MMTFASQCTMYRLLDFNRIEHQHVVLHNIGMDDTSCGKLFSANDWIFQGITHLD